MAFTERQQDGKGWRNPVEGASHFPPCHPALHARQACVFLQPDSHCIPVEWCYVTVHPRPCAEKVLLLQVEWKAGWATLKAWAKPL